MTDISFLWLGVAIGMVVGLTAIGVHAMYDLYDMRVIDSRSGNEVVIGDRVSYGDGEAVTLLDVRPGILSARARVRVEMRDLDDEAAGLPSRLVAREAWVDLHVRWMHPEHRMQWVAFLPS